MSTKIVSYIPPGLPPVFDPNPRKMAKQLSDWLQTFLANIQTYQFLVSSHLNSDTQDSGADIASASTITVSNFVHRVTGSTTISTINIQAATSASLLCLLIRDGLTINAAGNVKAARTYAAGSLAVLCWFPVESKWYPQ